MCSSILNCSFKTRKNIKEQREHLFYDTARNNSSLINFLSLCHLYLPLKSGKLMQQLTKKTNKYKYKAT